jgi:hypothetical protein
MKDAIVTCLPWLMLAVAPLVINEISEAIAFFLRGPAQYKD